MSPCCEEFERPGVDDHRIDALLVLGKLLAVHGAAPALGMGEIVFPCEKPVLQEHRGDTIRVTWTLRCAPDPRQDHSK